MPSMQASVLPHSPRCPWPCHPEHLSQRISKQERHYCLLLPSSLPPGALGPPKSLVSSTRYLEKMGRAGSHGEPGGQGPRVDLGTPASGRGAPVLDRTPPSLPVRQMGVEEVFMGQARSQISLEGLGESPGQTLIPCNLWRLRA